MRAPSWKGVLATAAFMAAWVAPVTGLAADPGAPAVHDVLADPPSELFVTVYRAPSREEGAIDLNDLGGFALVREVRTIRLPAGESRVRFEGVADGIEPVSAILTGLPEGVVEKNRDARLLSPASLIEAAAGKPVSLVRSNSQTGKTERVPGTILSDAEGGVLFQTAAGVEALRCSGLSESFQFTTAAGLSATPTLSVLVRTKEPVTRTVTLSYLARGFDWAADYTASLSADGALMDLGAWVTLANGNAVGFPAAHTQVVAGRLNRENEEVEPIDLGGPVLATCWPRGSTSNAPEFFELGRQALKTEDFALRKNLLSGAAAPAMVQEVVVTASRIEQEQLGDLKLYRVAEPTTFSSRQSKQVRLLDRLAIPVHRVYGATLTSDPEDEEYMPAYVLLRTKNDSANHLGLPLPSGRVSVLAPRDGTQLLLNEGNMRDLALNEEVEINMGASPDVQVKAVEEDTTIDEDRRIPLVPGVTLRDAAETDSFRVEVSNARASQIEFELKLELDDVMHVVRADHRLSRKNGRPVFRFTVPANRSVVVRYQTARIDTTVETDH